MGDATTTDCTMGSRGLGCPQSLSNPQSRCRHISASSSTTYNDTTGTYSHPVLVRTYSGPTSSTNRARPTHGDGHAGSQSMPTSCNPYKRSSRNKISTLLAHPLVHMRAPRAEVTLPPLEDFTFNSILAKIEPDIRPDLDCIADLCARSRYSLSNQYDIHLNPHVSGDKFIQLALSSKSSSSPPARGGGPTLQAVSVSDNRNTPLIGRNTAFGRGSAADGLETATSRSRSSDGERETERIRAAEVATQVLDKAGGPVPHPSSEYISIRAIKGQATQESYEELYVQDARARPTLAAAILDHSRTQARYRSAPSLGQSGILLTGKPAVPATSGSHLVSPTTLEGLAFGERATRRPVKEQTSALLTKPVVSAAIAVPAGSASHTDASRLRHPCGSPSTGHKYLLGQNPNRAKSYAEGILRELLKVAEPPQSREAKPPKWVRGLTGQ